MMATQNSASDSALAQSNVVNQLRNQIRSAETSSRVDGQARVSSGCAVTDRLLPGCGYQRGTLVQWLTGGGQAADYLSLLAAKQAAMDGGAIVVFDSQHQFYPPAAAAIGINLDNLIVLKSSSPKTYPAKRFHENEELEADLLWSIDQALRCPAVAAVWGPLGRIGERWFRRFQLSAESSGCLGLFVQPIAQARQPSWADVQWLVGGVTPGSVSSGSAVTKLASANKVSSFQPNSNDNRPNDNRLDNQSGQQHVRLQLARCRGAQTGKSLNLWINTITGNVQSARRDHERLAKTSDRQHGSSASGQQRTSSSHPGAVVSQLADPENRRRGA